jgi:glutathione S-transferase
MFHELGAPSLFARRTSHGTKLAERTRTLLALLEIYAARTDWVVQAAFTHVDFAAAATEDATAMTTERNGKFLLLLATVA